ncbi:hypothetical protein BDF20DRAFT_299385 [Mycotypha africana]|uniref:uncharacterized protein n=1 Tax=Mycotypha africana TaxID=64632 RepID=UPI002301B020|nr:uncharacterized protein BDF20DRAFT_299385 [Mycotypha africana]KAI8987986.1 hypothetical protein BDF20DRAFT_299385 [Mycotypha africana]
MSELLYWEIRLYILNLLYRKESLIRFVLTQLVLTAVAASACSTGVLTYILAPYINKIYLLENGLPQSTTAKKDENHNIEKYNITPNSIITIETMDILTRRRTSTLRLRDLVPALDSSFSTWKVNNQILKKQHELEQSKGIKPLVQQQKFWLDQRNIMGEMEIMSNILRVVNEQGQKQRLI